MKTLSVYAANDICTAGGTSGSEIKSLVLTLLARHITRPHSIIDVGAGKGELLTRLATAYPDAALAGMDALDKPAGIRQVTWQVVDLNRPPDCETKYDVVLCSEVIEHVENPRNLFRFLANILSPEGILIATTPNQTSIRSVLSLFIYGHFVSFRDECYPAHISPLLVKDIRRIVNENRLDLVDIAFSDVGRIPSLPRLTWQRVSFGVLRGRAFSDNVAVVARKPRASSKASSQRGEGA